MDAATFHGLWTGALLVMFIGIVAWAWSSKRKRAFDEAANIPLDEDDQMDPSSAGANRNNDHD